MRIGENRLPKKTLKLKAGGTRSIERPRTRWIKERDVERGGKPWMEVLEETTGKNERDGGCYLELNTITKETRPDDNDDLHKSSF